jgi:putative thioredoxin
MPCLTPNVAAGGMTRGGVATVWRVDVTDTTFTDEVIERSHREPVVVDFWAEWCGPCKALAPVLEEATRERGVALAKLDTDANPQTSAEYGIRGIPAVKAFRNGHVVSEFVGALPPARVSDFLDELTKPPVAETLSDDPEVATALQAGDYERALETLLDRVETAGPSEQEGLRELMVRIFGELGPEHPLAASFRRKLAAALY